jgi:hypothetical protein
MSERPTSGPAPRWGEYGPDVPPPPPVPAEQRPEPEPEPEPTLRPRESADARPQRSWDLAATIGLLALGTLNTLVSIPSLLDLPFVLDTMYQAAGYGDYTSDALASGVGIAANIVQIVLLILAVWLSTISLRARRLTFWIPLTAGAVSTIVLIVLFAVAMIGDPALQGYAEEQMRQATTAP